MNSAGNIRWKAQYPSLMEAVSDTMNQSIADLIDKNGADKFESVRLTNLFVNTVFKSYDPSLKDKLPIKNLNTRTSVFYLHQLYNNPDITRSCKITENPDILKAFQGAMAEQFEETSEIMLTYQQKEAAKRKPAAIPNFDGMESGIIFEEMETETMEALKEQQRQLLARFEPAPKIAKPAAPVAAPVAPALAAPKPAAVSFVIPNKTNEQFNYDFRVGRPTLTYRIISSGKFSDLLDRMLSISTLQASHYKESAEYNIENTVGQFLDLVSSGDRWKELITALAQTPGLTNCVTLFGAQEPASPLPFVPVALPASNDSCPEVELTLPVKIPKKTSKEFQACVVKNKQKLVNKIASGKTLESLLDLMPSVSSLKAAGLRSLAPRERTNATNQLLDIVMAVEIWEEFIHALSQVRTTTGCVEFFCGKQEPKASPAEDARKFEEEQRRIFGLFEAAKRSLAVEASRAEAVRIPPAASSSGFPPLYVGEVFAGKPAGYSFDSRDFNVDMRPAPAPAPAARNPDVENHEFYKSRMIQHRAAIIASLVGGHFFQSLINYMPSINSYRTSLSSKDEKASNQILDWVVENKQWSEFINALREIGLPAKANLFNK